MSILYDPRTPEAPSFQVWFLTHPGSKENIKVILEVSVNVAGVKCKFYEDCFNLYHLIGPNSCNKLSWLLKNISDNDKELEGLEQNPIIKAMESIADPGVYPRGFVLHLTVNKRKSAKLISNPRRFLNRQEESNLEEQEQLNDLIVDLATYSYQPMSESAKLRIWDSLEVLPESDNSLKFKAVTRGRYTHKKKEYLNSLKDQKKAKAKDTKGSKRSRGRVCKAG